MDWQASWIWTADATPRRNAWVRFRRTFDYAGGPASLRVTADSRYTLYVNGERLGQGPVRAWPAHWRYDEYDLAPHLSRGANVVAALVQHYGEGTFQYIPGPPGLLAELRIDGAVIGTDASWVASPDRAIVAAAPRISVQEGFEEQYDARAGDGWTLPGYDDAGWPAAVALRPADDGFHADLQPRGIPFLTNEPVLPQRLVAVEVVHSILYLFTAYVKPYLAPDDLSSNHVVCNAYLATRIHSDRETEVTLFSPHKWTGAAKLNGAVLSEGKATLRAGWNDLLVSIRGMHHLPEYTITIDGPEGLVFDAGNGAAWAVVGPFAFGPAEEAAFDGDHDETTVDCRPLVPEATAEAGEAFWAQGELVDAPFVQPIQREHLYTNDAFAQSYTDRVTGAAAKVENTDALLSGSGWTTIHPAPDGADVRLLVDFGTMVVGYHRFDLVAPAGVVVDLHNFEFIQPDGRKNFAEGMNNSSRYVCKEGKQTYQTLVRRGFRFSYLTFRNLNGPVKLGGLQAVFASYPQQRRGSFACSDAQLDRIWQVGAHTLRCCAEDTYTDCPTYEQTHWVGDARNEALIDWVINGDPRLWFRCLQQVGQSLERSPITEGQVPSAWQSILPAWSFLWMRSCREYLLHTGDAEGARQLLAFIERNVAGIRGKLNADGLFEIRAWNMFDWAEMDTPNRGVVTHQNCMAVHALRDTSEMAEWLGRADLAAEWRALAADLSAAINRRLWNEEHQAYTDCLRGSEHSPVYSQQTQTAAVMGGVATGERAARCLSILHNPPEGFVRAGSPFFEFFLLEAYQSEGREQAFLDTIRRDWGFMVDMGANTFWEMWSMRGERLTRSHCHGWSAAPTYFLSSYVVGVRPGGPGYAPVIVEPHPADLKWLRATVPTPHGDVRVQWENEPEKPFVVRVEAPEGLEIWVRLPRPGVATVNGKPAA